MTTTVTEDEDPMGVARVVGLPVGTELCIMRVPDAPLGTSMTNYRAEAAEKYDAFLREATARAFINVVLKGPNMPPNVNPETGMRYGIISANSLDPEVVDEIQSKGRDVHYEEALKELDSKISYACREYLCSGHIDEVVMLARELFDSDYNGSDEPVHEFEIDCPGYGPVIGQTTWLGGALMVYIFKSPFQEACDLCSPCVPNCGNLDSRNPDGYQCYDVPADWRAEP